MTLLSIIVLAVSVVVAWLAWLEYREDLLANTAISKSRLQNTQADTCCPKERAAERKNGSSGNPQSS
jgi:hypothetical protein